MIEWMNEWMNEWLKEWTQCVIWFDVHSFLFSWEEIVENLKKWGICVSENMLKYG